LEAENRVGGMKARKEEELCVVCGLPLKDHPEGFLSHYGPG